jgi:WhiB family redox-sensing transcriptional regulator
MRDALCREYPDVTWFPTSTLLVDYDEPKAVCSRCLVRAECLEYALERRIDYGVWGGMTAPDRRRVIAEQIGRPVRRRTRRPVPLAEPLARDSSSDEPASALP